MPTGLAVDTTGTAYVTEDAGNVVRKVTPGAVVTTWLGDGTAGYLEGAGTAAKVNVPQNVLIDGPLMYLADRENHRVRIVDVETVVTTQFAGDGTAGTVDGARLGGAQFNAPIGLAFNAAGSSLFVSQKSGHVIRKIDMLTGVVTTFTGTQSAGTRDGYGTHAQHNHPYFISMDDEDNLWVPDHGSGYVRKISTKTSQVSTAIIVQWTIYDVCWTRFGVFVTHQDYNKVTAFLANEKPHAYIATPSTSLQWTLGDGTSAYQTGTRTSAKFPSPLCVVQDWQLGDTLVGGHGAIARVTSTGVMSDWLGSGTQGTGDNTGTSAGIDSAVGIVVHSTGDYYFCEYSQHTMRKATSAAVVTTIAGVAGTSGYVEDTGTAARFNNPSGIAETSDGSMLFADRQNNRIRKLTTGGTASLVAGDGTEAHLDGLLTAARFKWPTTVNMLDDNIYFVACVNHVVRKVTGGVVTTFAGVDGTSGVADGTGTAATFNDPRMGNIDADGILYVSQRGSGVTNGGRFINTHDAIVTSFAADPAHGFFATDSGVFAVHDSTNQVKF